MFKALPVLIVALALSACSEAPPKAPTTSPTSIQQLNKSIANVVQTNDQTTSIHVRQPGYQDDIALFSLATTTLRTLEGAKSYNLMPNTEQVRVLAFVPFTDAYGNKKMEPVLGLIFDTKDLHRINFTSKAFTEFNLVDLAESVWRREDGRYSQEAVQAYCRKYGQHSQQFCQREAF